MVPSLPEPKQSKSIDYLHAQRVKRSENAGRENRDNGYVKTNWEDYGGEEQGDKRRFGEMFQKALRIEEEAKRKEQLLLVSNQMSMPESMRCNEMLLDAMKAKLSLLEKL